VKYQRAAAEHKIKSAAAMIKANFQRRAKQWK
jgi:hypothetical protein